jgi:hypothetical protein
MVSRLAVACVLFAGVMSAQGPVKPPHVVRASGDATITAKPDRARISVGVQTDGPTAEAASSENATQVSHVLTAVKGTLGNGGEVKTENYSVSPQFEYPKNGGPGKVVGYRANNIVAITIDDLKLVSKIIDLATGSGANNIEGIAFQLKDPAAVQARALAEAAAKARVNGEAIAKALNLRVVGVLQAEASGGAPPVRPMFMAARGMATMEAKQATPVEAGNLEIQASVTVTLEVE